MDWVEYLWFGLGLAAIALLTVGLHRWYGSGLGWLPLWSLARASVQLGVIALLLRGVLSVPVTVIAFVALMLSAASWTAMGRIHTLWHGRRAAVIGVLAGAGIALLAVFALRLVDLEARYLIAVGGIVIGNAMNAATLAGRNFMRSAAAHSDQIEAWLSIGATPAQAHDDVARESVRESLIPNLDQAKSTGLVTLPGAFVGALFGGASPAVAAMFQLVVLAGIALAMTVTAIVVTRIAARSPFIAAAS